MNAIHRIVLPRLLIAWLGVSLAAAGAVYLIERARFNNAIVDLVAAQAGKLELGGIASSGDTGAAYARTLEQTREFVSRNYVLIELYDPTGRRTAAFANPRFSDLEEATRPARLALPRDRDTRSSRLAAGDARLMHVRVPLPARDGGLAGHFEGLFVLDAATTQAFRQQLRRTLVAVLLAVLGTTVVLYPVILALNRSVLRASREILKGNLEMASVLGTAIAKRDSDTGDHNFRVTLYAIRLGEAAGLDDAALRGLILGAFLHDVGKIGIPDPVLLKPGRLDADEFRVMRTHVDLGMDIIAKSDWLAPAREVVSGHHEKYDGSGYPRGLKGEAIPLNARIFAIVDVFDALTSRRPYKAPMPVAESLAIIESASGTHFDPRLVARFLAIAETLHAEIGGQDAETLSTSLRQEVVRRYLGTAAPGEGAGA